MLWQVVRQLTATQRTLKCARLRARYVNEVLCMYVKIQFGAKANLQSLPAAVSVPAVLVVCLSEAFPVRTYTTLHLTEIEPVADVCVH